jgi:hypothetical protein
MHTHRSNPLRMARLLGGAALAAGVCMGMSPSLAAAASPTAPAHLPQVSQPDADEEAALVAAEDRRLVQVSAQASISRWQSKSLKTPYRLSTGSGYTLVLTAAEAPYTLADLRKLEPQTLLRMTDGSFILGENIVVMAGATLVLSQPGGLTLRLASGPTGFSSIVSLGGELEFSGTQAAPVNLTSWDTHAGTVDTDTADGRAYVRAIGGQFAMQYVNVKDLGFWSGRTGGVSLTGTSRPDLGALASVGKAKLTTSPDANTSPDITVIPVSPAGALPTGAANPDLSTGIPMMDYVSSEITHTTIDGDAFGLFITGANGLQISDSSVSNSQFAGIELHRFVSNGVIERTTTTYNGGDGFNLDRATQGIVISETTSTRNAGHGFAMSGLPLANGPSAVGSPLESYGNNSISNSVASNNARDGIEVSGGFNIGLANNRIDGNDMGIVVTDGTKQVAVTGNDVGGQKRHGIALVKGVSGATVTGNVVDGATTGIYVRDSQAQVKGNTVEHASLHGVSVVGSAKGTAVSYNVMAGSGPSALDTARTHGGVSAKDNQETGWHDTTPWYLYLKKLLHPMTLLWASILILVVLSAIRSRKNRAVVAHPYAHQMGHQMPVTVPAPATIDLTDEEEFDHEHDDHHADDHVLDEVYG